ncbi:hypothetical protein FNV43_RR07698 [Rhamnella rubrinervis]|uniref:Receptor-like serine/threonine-protein kinase n=1 Tax=Rhamnella rubrinervis TaxID=2594499 RepID=A0A8K0HH50_9ROSA|nr:hypothetical protein FNV43_RR07698 [Rhamnella rubrinervis]
MADCQMRFSRKNPVFAFHFFLFISVFCSLARLCSAAYTLAQGQSMPDGETLVSDGQDFELGFFSPENSTSRFVGIWYRNIPVKTYTWVANRESPISDKAGVLTIGSDGNLVVLNGNKSLVWSSNASGVSENSTAILNEKGNLILSSSDSVGDINKAYWQSFDNPTDTYLPGMRVVVNRAKGENPAFTSWKSDNNPSRGNYSLGLDPRGSPQIVIWEGSRRRWRSGPWNSQIFTGVPNMSSTLLYGFRLSNEDDDGNRYFTYVPFNTSDEMMFRIRWDGFEEQLRWEEDNNRWGVMQSQPASTNECELYNKCGNFSVCSSWESPICSCLEGFQPSHWDQWRERNWSGGCSRKTPLQCQRNSSEEDGFVGVKSVKLPDFADLLPPEGDADNCKERCLSNCTCTAYAYISGIGCLVWNGELLDVQHFTKGGSTLFIRLAHSDLGGGKSISTVLIVIIAIIGAALLGVFFCLAWRFKSKLKILPTSTPVAWLRNNEVPPLDARNSADISTELSGSVDLGIESSKVNGELPLFNFNFVAVATNNFSEENKLGQGGFGPVYKGMLPGGQEIAVKRLSRKSGQGVEEFKNEIILIAKLQHRNLVRLLGCCLEGEEKMLVYEYMPNKSLDSFLFDPEKQGLLDWRKRYAIIEGIARGLLYLHRDSRLRIIHRDLKASNILLDEDMNPKISDFGMARIFGGNQNEANTNRVVGTYGYMSPEYAMEGLFSVKSDVYSFGVLLLEIVSGRRNTSYRLTEYASLLGFAWHLWTEGKAMELVDPSMAETCTRNEALRCIQVGMLCVQDSPGYRPTMSSVVLMLESETANLPLPRQPTFTSMRGSVDTDFYSEGHDYASLNDLTVTMMVDGR